MEGKGLHPVLQSQSHSNTGKRLQESVSNQLIRRTRHSQDQMWSRAHPSRGGASRERPEAPPHELSPPACRLYTSRLM